MLWDIDGTPHRLLGSVHLLSENFTLPTWAKESLRGIECIVLESDYRDPILSRVGVDTSRAYLTLPGAADLYARAAAFLASQNIANSLLDLLPLQAAFYLSSEIAASTGLLREYGMDNRLRLHADRHHLPTLFLETPTRFFELVDLSRKDAMGEMRFFEHALNQCISGDGLAGLHRINRAWFEGDLATFCDIRREVLAKFQVVYEPLLTKRDREWVAIADPLIASKIPTLFVVGALHTVGTDSFIEQLRDHGIKLTISLSSQT